MNYQEALAAAEQAQAGTRFIRLDLTYNTFILLPYEAGMQVLQALAQAEYCEESYSTPPIIRTPDKEDIKFSFCSAEYRHLLHMAQLLNVSMDNLRQLKAEQQPPPF